MEIPFVKYHGAGNDFVLIDERVEDYTHVLSRTAIAAMCKRHLGIGADGLMRLQKSDTAGFHMVYYNADGRESSLCGNGSRCIVAFAKSLGIIEDYANFTTSDGLHEAWVLPGGDIRLRMHPPTDYRRINTFNHFVDTGSPHHVRFLNGIDVDAFEVFQEGRLVRNDSMYAPDGSNINFVNVDGPLALRVRTYERGVEDETLSCGTGVTACAYVHLIQEQLTDGQISISTPGGNLTVEVMARGKEDEEVFLMGPAKEVFQGTFPI